MRAVNPFQATEAVRRHIDQLKADYPELAEDDDLLAATIEGETDFERVLGAIITETQAQAGMAAGLGEVISDMRERASKIVRRSEAMRSLAIRLMQDAGMTTARLPNATLTVRSASQAVSITDDQALPQGTFTLQRAPDRKAIKEMLLAGEDVPGAKLEFGQPTLTIRVK